MLFSLLYYYYHHHHYYCYCYYCYYYYYYYFYYYYYYYHHHQALELEELIKAGEKDKELLERDKVQLHRELDEAKKLLLQERQRGGG